MENRDGDIREKYVKLPRGGLAYLESGPVDGPIMIFVHGWPSLALLFRKQLPVFGQLGFRTIAIDLPGFGRSEVHKTHGAYSMENINAQLIEFQDYLNAEKVIWIGHDWGSAIVWSLGAHYPERFHGLVSLNVPYRMAEQGVDHLLSLIDRNIYDEQEYPTGPWDYYLFYEENFDRATKIFEENVEDFFTLFLRKPNPEDIDKPVITAGVRARGGWFGDDAPPPPSARDDDIVSEKVLASYVEAFSRNGFFGPDSLYMNSKANTDYTSRAVNGGRLDMPVLFFSAEYDSWCDTVRNPSLGKDMREKIPNLTAVSIPTGHWSAPQEPTKVNSALAQWLVSEAKIWPKSPTPDWRPL